MRRAIMVIAFVGLLVTALGVLIGNAPRTDAWAFTLAPAHTQFAICFDPADGYVAEFPQGVWAGDFNGDGFKDMAAVQMNEDSVAIWLNDGDGTFTFSVKYGAANEPRAIVGGYFDANTTIDLAVAHDDASLVRVYLNNGDGTFTSGPNNGTGWQSIDLAAADLDNDGDVDIVTANYGHDNVSVLRNNGDGTFAAKVNYAAGDGPFGIVIRDFDGDTIPDLAVSNLGSANMSVLFNNGSATFTAATHYPVGSGCTDLASADFDGDLDYDLVAVASGPDFVRVFTNDGSGLFSQLADYSFPNYPNRITTDDMDRDGDMDIVVTVNLIDRVAILQNDGTGTFAGPFNYTGGTNAVYAADLDNDFNLDLATCAGPDDRLWVLLNCIPPCDCPAQGELWVDGMLDAIDLGVQIDIMRNAASDIADPNCPATRGDLNSDSVVNIFDVSRFWITLFLNNGTAPEPCSCVFPCPVPAGTGVGSVVIASDSTPIDAIDTIGIYLENSVGIVGYSIPLVIRAVDTYPVDLDGSYSSGGRLSQTTVGYVDLYDEANGACGNGGFANIDILGPSSPDGIHFFGFFVSGVLPAGTDGASPSLQIGFTAPSVPGSFEIDTTCCDPTNHLSLVEAETFAEIIPSFTMGTITVYDPCGCPSQSDLDGNGFLDAVDLNLVIDVLFFAGTDIQDPVCPITRSDFNNDGAPDALDMNELIDHLFFGGQPPVDPCL